MKGRKRADFYHIMQYIMLIFYNMKEKKGKEKLHYIIIAFVLLFYYINMPQFTLCEINMNVPRSPIETVYI